MNRSAVARVVNWLIERQVGHALCGGIAMSAWGAARSTADLDLVVADRRILDPVFWDGFRGGRVTVRPGDHADPLWGVVRIGPRAGWPVDLVVPKGSWVSGVVARASRTVSFAGTSVPVVSVADLVLLKLYAGGFLDLRDVAVLLATPEGREAVTDIEVRLPQLPDDASEAWRSLRASLT